MASPQDMFAQQAGLGGLHYMNCIGQLQSACTNVGGIWNAPIAKAIQPKERTVFQEIKNDVSTFVNEHRGVIYFIVLFLFVDHFIFKGVFKARLQGMMESLIKKVEEKVAA